MQRLDKLLSEAGVASRKDLKSIIRAGRVTVDGQVVKSPDVKVDERLPMSVWMAFRLESSG